MLFNPKERHTFIFLLGEKESLWTSVGEMNHRYTSSFGTREV